MVALPLSSSSSVASCRSKRLLRSSKLSSRAVESLRPVAADDDDDLAVERPVKERPVDDRPV